MLTATVVAPDMERVKLLLERYPERLIDAMRKANLTSGSVLLKMIKDKLSGPVLNFITGNLRRNWTQIMPIREENGWKGGVGTNTEYAAVHEFGMDKLFPGVAVKAHTRAQASRNTYRKSAANYRKGGAGVVLASSGFAHVKAFTRTQHVKIPARPYARPSLIETRPRIEAIHSDQIRQAWEKSQ